MAKCEHHQICGRDADGNTGEDLCILHSKARNKDKSAFDQALAEHRKKNGDNFDSFVFPGHTDFSHTEFSEKASFFGSEFAGEVDFSHANFKGQGEYGEAVFAETAKFNGASFEGEAEFAGAKFFKKADFTNAEFLQGGDFGGANFLGAAYFWGTNFAEIVHFVSAKFATNASFKQATFVGDAWFDSADFYGQSSFWRASFEGAADFVWAMFAEKADFTEARFLQKVDFSEAVFTGKANFSSVQFNGETDFFGTQFKNEADFHFAEFMGITFFAGGPKKRTKGVHLRIVGRKDYPPSEWLLKIFSGVEADFTDAIVAPLDALIIRDADLRKCRFLGTDLRKAEITGAEWPEIGHRRGVHDEVAPLKMNEKREWHHIERLYRELKQNYEDRRDYERAGDFHYGEKEMRRLNPQTSWGVRLWLTLYWLASGYGERWLRPLICSGLLLVVSTLCYLHWGLLVFKDGGPLLDRGSLWEAGLYGLKVMTLLKPSNFTPLGFWGDFINTAQSVFGPILIGLFALALRQRLKR